MAIPDVVFCLTGDVRKNSRALRQIRALALIGFTIEVMTFGPPVYALPFEANVRLRVLPQPGGHGPRFFVRVHRLFISEAMRIPARLYHAGDLYALPAMRAAAQRHSGYLVYDARELYPYVASTIGRPWARWIWKHVEARNIPFANHIFTVSPSIADRIAKTYRVSRPTVLYNVPPFQSIMPSNRLRHKAGISANSVVVLHQGQMRKDRGCTLLIDAMRDVSGAVLVFLGDGPLKTKLIEQVNRTSLGERVQMLDPVSPDELHSVTASADIGVTLLEDTCLNHRFALPNKLFEYLMAGLPVLASDLPEMSKVVTGHQVGCIVDPANRSALVNTLQHMVDNVEARKRWSARTSSVFETFSWEKASQDLQRAYSDLLNTKNA